MVVRMRDGSTQTMNTKTQRLCLASIHCPGTSWIYNVSGYQEELPGRRVKYPVIYPSLKNRRIASAFLCPSGWAKLNPDSAVEIEAAVHVWCKPGAARRQGRIVSRSCLTLGPLLRFVSRDCLCTEAELPLRGRGVFSSPWRAYTKRSTLLPTVESALNTKP